MRRGTKKTIEALEQKFETQKKPTQQDFFDLLSSFYHKDEDLAFLISISKATLTDAQAGEDHTRFMTALRTYQAIQYWTRLAKLNDLYTDVNSLIMTRIGEMWSQLLATNDTNVQIDTLGEVFLVLQNFNEWTGGIKAEFDWVHSLLKDLTGERVVKNTFDNHNGRISNIESRLKDVPNNERQVQNNFDSLFSLLRDMSGDRTVRNNFDHFYSLLKDLTGERVVKNTFDSHDGRIGNLEYRLKDVPNNERQVQNTFDHFYSLLRDVSGERAVQNNFDHFYSLLKDISGDRAVQNNFDDLFSRLKDLTGDRAVANILDSHDGRISAAHNRADDAYTRANEAHDAIGRPSWSTETAWSRMTGIYMYAEVVAGMTAQLESMLNGYTLGDYGTVKSSVDYVNGRVNSVQTDCSDIRSKLHDAGIAGF